MATRTSYLDDRLSANNLSSNTRFKTQLLGSRDRFDTYESFSANSQNKFNESQSAFSPQMFSQSQQQMMMMSGSFNRAGTQSALSVTSQPVRLNQGATQKMLERHANSSFTYQRNCKSNADSTNQSKSVFRNSQMIHSAHGKSNVPQTRNGLNSKESMEWDHPDDNAANHTSISSVQRKVAMTEQKKQKTGGIKQMLSQTSKGMDISNSEVDLGLQNQKLQEEMRSSHHHIDRSAFGPLLGQDSRDDQMDTRKSQ